MEYHELDPNGDIILTLRPQNLQPFPGATEAANSQLFGRGDLDSARFRLSSKHLIRASPVFRAMITGPWKESLAFAAAPVAKHSAGIPDEDTLPEITATEWDKETFLLLLEILHGRYEPLKDPLPDVDACMLVKMCVMLATAIAMRFNNERLEGRGLPLPYSLLNDIENKRTGALRQIMTHLYQVRESLRTGQDGYGCCQECAYALHEDFVKALDNVGLAGLSLDETSGNGSVRYVREAVLTLRLPPWSTYHQSNRIIYTSKCNIHVMLQPVINRVWCELQGLRLGDYQATSKGGSPAWENTTFNFEQ